MKTRKDNDMTNCMGLVYIDSNNELSRPIWQSVVNEEN